MYVLRSDHNQIIDELRKQVVDFKEEKLKFEGIIKDKDNIVLGMWKDFIGIHTFDDYKKLQKNGLEFISNQTSQSPSRHLSPSNSQDRSISPPFHNTQNNVEMEGPNDFNLFEEHKILRHQLPFREQLFGFTNLGLTCYAGAALQAVQATSYYLGAELLFTKSPHPNQLEKLYKDTFVFKDLHDQNDSSEAFFEFISKQPWGSNLNFQLSRNTTCRKCVTQTVTKETHNRIDLQCSGDALEKCLQHFLKPELLEGGESYDCANCKEKTCATTCYNITSLNDIVVVNLKRYGYQENQVYKNNGLVDFPFQISIDCQKYEMFAFVLHCNSKIVTNGHYKAYVNCTTCWYEFDDEKVTMVMPTQLKELTNRGYYYCYRRVKASETQQHSQLIEQGDDQSQQTIDNPLIQDVTYQNQTNRRGTYHEKATSFMANNRTIDNPKTQPKRKLRANFEPVQLSQEQKTVNEELLQNIYSTSIGGKQTIQQTLDAQKIIDFTSNQVKKQRHHISNFFSSTLAKHRTNPLAQLARGFKKISPLFCDGIGISHPYINETIQKQWKFNLDRALKQASEVPIKNVLSKWNEGCQWITFEYSSAQIDLAFFKNLFVIIDAFREFACENLNMADEDAQNIELTQLDVTINLKGTFISFQFAVDYQSLKEKLEALCETELFGGYFQDKTINVANGDNSMSTCMQYQIKCLKKDSLKEKHTLIRCKLYAKIIDLLQKESVGKVIGSKIGHLLGANLNPDKFEYDQTQKSWKQGMSRGELSNYFSKERPFEQELGTIEGQNRFIAFHEHLFEALILILNSSELKKLVAWKIDTTELLDDVAHLNNNLCVIGPNNVTLVIADNQAQNRHCSSFMGATRAIKLGGPKAKKNRGDLRDFIKRNASCGADIAVFRHNSDKLLGTVRKRGEELFVPPNVCRPSHYNPCVPESFRFVTSDGILDCIQLEGFEKVIEAYDDIEATGTDNDKQTAKTETKRPIAVRNKKAEAQKEAQSNKSELKAADKALVRKAKENSRKNRDKEMGFFVAYYKENYAKTKFIAFKTMKNHPWRIQQMIMDETQLVKMRRFIENHRRSYKVKE